MRIILTSVWILLSSLQTLGQTIIFPHLADGFIADGSKWTTEIDIVNSSSLQQSGKVSFFDPRGEPLFVLFGSGAHTLSLSSLDFKLRPNEMWPLLVDSSVIGSRPLKTGWVSIEATGGIHAFMIIRRTLPALPNPMVLAEVGFSPNTPSNKIDFIPRAFLRSEGVPVNPEFPDIAYALANPDPLFSASGEIQLFDKGGLRVGASSFNLGRREQLAEFLSQRFADLKLDEDYYIRIEVTTGKVSAMALRVAGSLLASIPTN